MREPEVNFIVNGLEVGEVLVVERIVPEEMVEERLEWSVEKIEEGTEEGLYICRRRVFGASKALGPVIRLHAR